MPALKHNYLTIRNHLSAPAQLMAVVKANAYGHGAVECARALEAINADWFGVALVEEGIELRRAGITRPIFCLSGFWRGQADDSQGPACLCEGGSRLDTGERFDLVRKFAKIEIWLSDLASVDIRLEHVLGSEHLCLSPYQPKTLQHQPRSGEQHQRDRELRDHEEPVHAIPVG